VGYSPTVHLDEIITRVVEYWTMERQTQPPSVVSCLKFRAPASHAVLSPAAIPALR